jgi:hypothetical protein
MNDSDRTNRRPNPLLLPALAALLSLIIGFVVGFTVRGTATSPPESCEQLTVAVDSLADVVEAEWATASAAVDAVQIELADSDVRALAAACREEA